MTQKKVLFAAMALCTALALRAFAEETAAAPTAATVVATVNGTDITLGNMIVARNALPPEYQSLPDDLIYGGLLDQVIQQVIIEQSMEGKLKLVDELTILNERRTYLASLLVVQIAGDALTDAALQKAYDAAYAEFKSQTEYRASHILVEEEELAKTLLAEIEAGAVFAEVAMANSTDGSAQGGGDLGWFGLGMMVEPFEVAVVAAEVGKVIGPVQTEFGFHLILVTETRNSEKPPLDTVRVDLEAGVQRDAVLAAVDVMVKAAKIEKPEVAIDPALLKNTDLLNE